MLFFRYLGKSPTGSGCPLYHLPKRKWMPLPSLLRLRQTSLLVCMSFFFLNFSIQSLNVLFSFWGSLGDFNGRGHCAKPCSTLGAMGAMHKPMQCPHRPTPAWRNAPGSVCALTPLGDSGLALRPPSPAAILCT